MQFNGSIHSALIETLKGEIAETLKSVSADSLTCFVDVSPFYISGYETKQYRQQHHLLFNYFFNYSMENVYNTG